MADGGDEPNNGDMARQTASRADRPPATRQHKQRNIKELDRVIKQERRRLKGLFLLRGGKTMVMLALIFVFCITLVFSAGIAWLICAGTGATYGLGIVLATWSIWMIANVVLLFVFGKGENDND